MHKERVLAIDHASITISNDKGPRLVEVTPAKTRISAEATQILPIRSVTIRFLSKDRRLRDIQPGDMVKVQEASGGGFGYPTLFFA